MKVINSDRFYLQGTNKRFLHMASVTEGLREYMCFVDMTNQKCYIEEMIGGHLAYIEDDSCVEEIANLLTEKHILDMKYGIAAPDKQYE